ncbi:type II toxin-antitoxin system HipA family toxin [Lonepinella koalarum]|uniref:HipA N-terminal domain-containing protein n=1 Tax=Lonepinella koalarum TaxID=53417 RepID=UPI0011E44834|nr:HipA N-terminal domain-containing protein [Lonepinella koalarum]TYG34704.1 type II toxin-antitoxin system HipA family toxin [Lonepinella koalarum]
MRPLNRTARVFLYDEQIGWLNQDDSGFSFAYLPTYQGIPLSLSLPVEQKTFHAKQLFPYFASLVPEGWLKEKYSQLQRIDEQDLFGLLLNNSKNMLGAIRLERGN